MLDPKERFRKYSLRFVFDSILYIVKPVAVENAPIKFRSVTDGILLLQQVEERGLA